MTWFCQRYDTVSANAVRCTVEVMGRKLTPPYVVVVPMMISGRFSEPPTALRGVNSSEDVKFRSLRRLPPNVPDHEPTYVRESRPSRPLVSDERFVAPDVP